MKPLTFLSVTLPGIALPAHSQVSPIRREVEQTSKTGTKPKEPAAGYSEPSCRLKLNASPK